jgi:hypothetical protein
MIPTPALSGLPRTGQVTSFRTGDDGDLKAGHPSTSRFQEVSGTGLVLDTLYTSGLMWAKTPHLMVPGPSGVVTDNTATADSGDWATLNGYTAGEFVSENGGDAGPYYICIEDHTAGVFADDLAAGKWVISPWLGSAADMTTAGTMSWNDAIDNCLALDYGGYDDWRLPNIHELFSLRSFIDVTSPTILPPFSILAATNELWSSTTRAITTTAAFTGIFDTSVGVGVPAKVGLLAVMPVRGGVLNGA